MDSFLDPSRENNEMFSLFIFGSGGFLSATKPTFNQLPFFGKSALEFMLLHLGGYSLEMAVYYSPLVSLLISSVDVSHVWI